MTGDKGGLKTPPFRMGLLVQKGGIHVTQVTTTGSVDGYECTTSAGCGRRLPADVSAVLGMVCRRKGMPTVSLALPLASGVCVSESGKHLEYYLDEYTFRFNRRTSRSRGLLFYRLMEQAVATAPLPYRQIVGGNHNW